MFSSKAHPEVRKLPRSSKVQVEVLEDRLQPGSVLFGLGFSLLGLSLPDLDAALLAPEDLSAQRVHPQPGNRQKESLRADLVLQSLPPSASGSAAEANAAMPPARQETGGGPALPLTSNLLALSTGSTRASNLPVSVPHSATAPTVTVLGTQAAPSSQALSVGSPAASQLALAQPGMRHSAGSMASAIPVPAADWHHLTASVITHGNTEGPGEIHPDASVNWATYVSGTAGSATGRGVAVDTAGYIYATGYTDDGNTRMAFVAKYDNTGNQLAFSGFQVQDSFINYVRSEGHAIAVDGSGGVYVTGKATDSLGGDTDAFLMKFQLDPNNPNQFLPVAGYGGGIGGQLDDSGEAVTVDAQGEATITGTFKPTGAETDIFAAKYTADGTDLFFANSYRFMGADGSAGNAIALDSTGSNAYLAGSIHVIGGDNDILVLKIDNGTGDSVSDSMPFFTMTNAGDDTLNGIGVDPRGQVYVVGTLAVADGTSAFVGQVSADGSSLANQYLIPNTQNGAALALDPAHGGAYVLAATVDSSNNPHAFVQYVDPSLTPGDAFMITGNGMDPGSAVAYDSRAGIVYVTGTTTSTNLATDSTVLNGASDAFLSDIGNFG